MPRSTLRFPMPFGGLNDDEAFGDQPAGTTRDALNVRSIDPKTGRRRISQRPGLSKYISTQLDSTPNKPKRMESVVFDSRAITYANTAAGTIETNGAAWANFTPGKNPSHHVKVDREGNVYALDGNMGLVKYNPAGKQVLTLQFPADANVHQVRALDVDEFGCVYAATSLSTADDPVSGQSDARIWRYRPVLSPNEEPTLELAWEIKPGAFVIALEYFNGRLYTAQNKPDSQRSELVVYQNLSSVVPDVEFRSLASYPMNDLAVKADGACVTASEPFADRGDNPKSPGATAIAVGADPRDILADSSRIWSWLDAQDINGNGDGNAGLDNGDPVNVWRDKSGNGRDMYGISGNITRTGSGTYASASPELRLEGLSGLPTVHFEIGELDVGSSPPRMLANGMVSQSGVENTLLPTGDDDMFALFLVVRPKQEADSTSLTDARGTILCQNNQDGNRNAGGSTRRPFPYAVVSNLDVDGSATSQQPGTVGEGYIGLHDVGDPDDDPDGTGAPSGRKLPINTASGSISATEEPHFDNASGAAIVSIIMDGGIDTGSNSTNTRSLFRVNGQAYDRYTSRQWRGRGPTMLGFMEEIVSGIGTPETGQYEPYDGEIAEILVVTFQNKTAGAADKILTHPLFGTDAGTDDANYSATDTEMEKIEGYLAHKWGISHLLTQYTYDGNTYTHPYAADCPTVSGKGDPNDLTEIGSVVAKYLPNSGELEWALPNIDGTGYGVRINSDGNIYSMGPGNNGNNGAATNGANDVYLRMIVDRGADGAGTDPTASYDEGDPWEEANANITPQDKYPRMDVDEFDNVYVPLAHVLGDTESFEVYQSDGTQLLEVNIENGTPTTLPVFSIAVPPKAPDYGTLSDKRAECVYLGMNPTPVSSPSDTPTETVRKYSLVTVTAQTGSTRDRKNLAVTAGDIKTFTSSAVATPTGGSGALSSTAPYVSTAVLKSQAFVADGISYKVYDPVADTVTDWEATSAGNIPPRCRLMAVWRGRVVLSGDPEDRADWHMSAVGDAYDWDSKPPIPLPTQAISGSNQLAGGNSALAGPVPDIVNSLVPYNDDLLIFGGDRTIWRLTGDPMKGGEMDLVSDITGMSWGRSWTKDPEGRLYFFGSRGGVFVMPPGGIPQRLTQRNIERRLQDVDLEDYYVELAWDYRNEGMWVFQFPFGAGGTIVKRWFWDQKNNAWWEDQAGDADKQATAYLLLDGDESSDRVLLFGCEDSFVRKVDEDAVDDDGTAVDSYVTVGPVVGDAGYNIRLDRFTAVLANDQSGCDFQTFSSQIPDIDLSASIAQTQGSLGPGRNPTKSCRTRDAYVWLRLRNTLSQRWAIEMAEIQAYSAGRKRKRAST